MPETAAKKITVFCGQCGATVEAKSLQDGGEPQPKGWHRLQGTLWCPKCWHDGYCLRSIELPVASVIEGYADDQPGEWNQPACAAGWTAFRAALRQSAHQAAQYSNLVLAECFAADRAPLIPVKRPKRTAEGEETGEEVDGVRLPPLAFPETYQLGRERFPELDSQTLGSLRQKAQAKYKEQRWDLRVTGKESLSSYRRELPVPIPSKDARLEVSHRHQQDRPEDERQPGRGQPFLRLRLAGKRFTLRLRSGAGNKHGEYSFWRKVAALEKIAAGQALQGEVKLYERRAPSANGRNGSQERAAPGAPSYATRVFAAVTCWLPKEKGERTPVEIRVVTSPERLWNVWVGEKAERPWLLHEEQARRWVIARRQRLQKLSDDTKFERRARLREHPMQPADLASVRQRISEMYQKRLADWAHKASCMLANFARRQRACRLIYNDSDTSWCPGAPWFTLRSLLADKLGRFGIEFAHQTSSEESSAS